LVTFCPTECYKKRPKAETLPEVMVQFKPDQQPLFWLLPSRKSRLKTQKPRMVGNRHLHVPHAKAEYERQKISLEQPPAGKQLACSAHTEMHLKRKDQMKPPTSIHIQ